MEEWGDYLSAGQMAMRKPIQRYDPSRGVPLWAYAYHFVRGAIVRTRGELFGLKGSQIDHYKRVRSTYADLSERSGTATVSEETVAREVLARYGVSVSVRTVGSIIAAQRRQQTRGVNDEGELDRLALHLGERES